MSKYKQNKFKKWILIGQTLDLIVLYYSKGKQEKRKLNSSIPTRIIKEHSFIIVALYGITAAVFDTSKLHIINYSARTENSKRELFLSACCGQLD